MPATKAKGGGFPRARGKLIRIYRERRQDVLVNRVERFSSAMVFTGRSYKRRSHRGIYGCIAEAEFVPRFPSRD